MGAVLFASCKKDFLNLDPYNEVPNVEAITSESSLQTATYGMYSQLRNANLYGRTIPLIGDLMADNLFISSSNSNRYIAEFNYTYINTNANASGTWGAAYTAILRANNIINADLPQSATVDQLKGEAKTVRALMYFILVNYYAKQYSVDPSADGVPIILEYEPHLRPARNKVSEVYAQIEKDLTEAMAVLPNKSNYSPADRFRVSKGTAQALLGKALLYQQKWNDAATQLEAVITSNQYSLASSIGAAFSRNHEFGPESIFEVSYTNARSYDWGNFPWDFQPESNIHIQLMGPRGDYYTKAPADSLIAGWGFNLPKQKLWDAFVAAGDVNRRRQTVMSEVELKAAGGNWTNSTAYDYEGFFQRKYGSFQSQTGSPIGELNYGTNWRQIRYADVLLMAAEAFYRASNEPKARGYINQVRQRSGLADISASGGALFNAIVLERQLELAFEGVRFTDLVRWNLASQELGAIGFKPNKHELLPIPDYDVRTGKLTQNQGF